MSTTLHYNGITLRECETRLFDQIVEYDSSGTDSMFTRFRVRVASTMIAGPTTGETVDKSWVQTPLGDMVDLSSRVASIAARLNESRGDFWMELTTEEPRGGFMGPLLFAAGDPRGSMAILHETQTPPGILNFEVPREAVLDVDNGPKPKSVSITQILGGTALRVEFEIEVCRVIFFEQQANSDQYPWQVPSGMIPASVTNMMEQNPANPTGPSKIVPVLSNRWSMTETRDATWRIERKVSGVLRVRHSSYFAHSMRFLAMPGLQRGFQRRVCNWIGDPTGLTLKYEIVDVQRDAAPPPPAVDWKGSVHATGDNGGATILHISLNLIGQPGVDKAKLLSAGGYVISQKLPGLAARLQAERDGEDNPFLTNCILKNVAVYVSLDEPVVKFDVTATTVIAEYKQLATSMQYITAPLQVKRDEENRVTYDPQRWPIPLPMMDSAPQNIFSCYLQKPYSIWHGIPRPISYQSPSVTAEVPNERPSEEEGYGYDKYYMDDHEITIRENDRQLITSEQLTQFPVTFYFIKNTYDTDTGVLQLERSIIPPSPEVAEFDPENPAAYDSQYDTCRFVQIHGGRCTRTLRVEATRTGKMPQLPEPTEDLVDPNGIRERLLHTEHELMGPQFTKDLVTRDISAAVTYVYGLSRPPQKWERLRMATSPFDTLTPTAALIDQTEAYAATDKIEWRPGA